MDLNSINIEIPAVDLTDLDFLASLISPEIASASPLSSPTSPASSGYASELYPSSSTSSGSSSPTSTYYYPSPSPFPLYDTPASTPAATPSFYPQSSQYFFPSSFTQALSPPPPPAEYNPSLLQSSMSSFLAHNHSPIYGDSPNNKSLAIEKSGLKNRRASRSKCPCLKCCHARANHIPSPTYHGCVVKGCQKTYTRPAHLRSHLKSHDNDAHLKCVICSKNFVTSDMLIAHMFDHGAGMKL